MLVVSEYKIKGRTWGYLSNPECTEFLTGWCRDKDGWSGREWVVKDGVGDYVDRNWISHPGMNVVLSGPVTIGDVERGRSAAGCMVQGPEQEFYMSVGNVVKTLQAVAHRQLHAGQGVITGAWTFAKQGDTISLTPYWPH